MTLSCPLDDCEFRRVSERQGCVCGRKQVSAVKEFTIIVKPFRAAEVLDLLAGFGVVECVVRECKGYSRQKGYLDRYIGSEYSLAFLPKVEIVAWVDDERADELARRIAETARTGRIGDGKIFSVPCAWPEAIEF